MYVCGLVFEQPAVQFCSDHSAYNIALTAGCLLILYIALSVPLMYIIGAWDTITK